MTAEYLSAAQWIVQGILVVVVALGKWGMSQKEKVHKLELQAITTDAEQTKKQLLKQTEEVENMRKDVQAIRERTERTETYVHKFAEDFTRALDSIEKVTDRLNTISEKMLTKQDLQLILQVRGD